MQRHRLTGSTTFVWADYDAVEATLDLAFRDGEVYRFFMVPAHVFHELAVAPSAGSYFWEKIRGRYPQEQIS